ncbi:hypothetical protein INT45_012315 [Circinella minor]|uniref:Uncharacterized protein n=1 Tax=Circinella minor TaxID=1195481 RepID=A0A8H7S5F8_9FUNG|nr:hypothetical protein INT45_012315 [Circinella minor]
MNIILKTIVENGECLDGKRLDAFFILTTKISDLIPPVLIEVQNVVDKAFVRRLNKKYCNHAYDKYNMESIASTISIKNTRVELYDRFIDSSNKAPFLKKITQ